MALQDLGLVVGILLLLGGCGWWAMAPFRGLLGFPAAAAPLPGTVLLPLATLGIHVPFALPIGTAAAIAVPALLGLTLIAGTRGPGRRESHTVVIFCALVALAASSVWFVMRTDLVVGAPGLLYYHGSDHLGYAHLADWLRGPARKLPLTANQTGWYESWPDYMFTRDPRFGSIALLGIVGALSRRSSSFAYDLTSAIVLTAVALGLAGIVARRRVTFLLVAAGLFTSFWFDWSRTGYLGKITGMPATLLGAGLYMAWTRLPARDEERALYSLAAVLAVVSGAALMLSGMAFALLIACVGLAFLVVV